MASRQSRRNAVLVMPAIGASTTGGSAQTRLDNRSGAVAGAALVMASTVRTGSRPPSSSAARAAHCSPQIFNPLSWTTVNVTSLVPVCPELMLLTDRLYFRSRPSVLGEESWNDLSVIVTVKSPPG